MENDSYLTPRIFKIRNQDGIEVEINSLFIFYIKVTKETKTFYLTEPISIEGEEKLEIRFKTREYGIIKLLELLGSKGFKQINRTTIIRNLYISGRDHNWKYIYVTMPFLRAHPGNNWKNIALPLGRKFAPQFKKHILESLFSVKDKDGDIFHVSSTHIVYMEISCGKKILYLSRPVCRNDKNMFILEWYSRDTFEKLLSESDKLFFIQVHRKYYVRIDYPFKVLQKHGKTHLILNKSFQEDNERHITEIPVGERFKKQIIEIFNNN